MIGIAAGALAVALTAPGALAGAPPREDALGDVAQSKGDIVTGTYTASFVDSFLTRVKARVTLRQGTNPLTAGGWRLPATGLTMQLDTTNTHTGPDLSVVLRSVDDGGVTFVANVTDLVAGEPVPCSATATFTAPNVYKVNLPSDCLPGSVTSVRGRFRMRWDQPPAGGRVTLDSSPDTGWGPTVARGADVPARITAVNLALAGRPAGSATINFTAPADNGAAIDRYSYRLSNGAFGTTSPGGVIAVPTCQSVTAQVWAHNSEGNAAASPASNSVQSYNNPSATVTGAQKNVSGPSASWSWSTDSGCGGAAIPGVSVSVAATDKHGTAGVASGTRNVSLAEGESSGVRVSITTNGPRGSRSASDSDSVSRQAPPPPTVTVSRGSSAAGRPGCSSSPDCSFLRVSYSNFPNANHSYSCNTMHGGSFFSGTNYSDGRRVSGSSGSGQLSCWADPSVFGGVYVVLDGVRSNTANW